MWKPLVRFIFFWLKLRTGKQKTKSWKRKREEEEEMRTDGELGQMREKK